MVKLRTYPIVYFGPGAGSDFIHFESGYGTAFYPCSQGPDPDFINSGSGSESEFHSGLYSDCIHFWVLVRVRILSSKSGSGSGAGIYPLQAGSGFYQACPDPDPDFANVLISAVLWRWKECFGKFIEPIYVGCPTVADDVLFLSEDDVELQLILRLNLKKSVTAYSHKRRMFYEQNVSKARYNKEVISEVKLCSTKGKEIKTFFIKVKKCCQNWKFMILDYLPCNAKSLFKINFGNKVFIC